MQHKKNCLFSPINHTVFLVYFVYNPSFNVTSLSSYENTLLLLQRINQFPIVQLSYAVICTGTLIPLNITKELWQVFKNACRFATNRSWAILLSMGSLYPVKSLKEPEEIATVNKMRTRVVIHPVIGNIVIFPKYIFINGLLYVVDILFIFKLLWLFESIQNSLQ